MLPVNNISFAIKLTIFDNQSTTAIIVVLRFEFGRPVMEICRYYSSYNSWYWQRWRSPDGVPCSFLFLFYYGRIWIDVVENIVDFQLQCICKSLYLKILEKQFQCLVGCIVKGICKSGFINDVFGLMHLKYMNTHGKVTPSRVIIIFY